VQPKQQIAVGSTVIPHMLVVDGTVDATAVLLSGVSSSHEAHGSNLRMQEAFRAEYLGIAGCAE
jgi:hypothetical protein